MMYFVPYQYIFYLIIHCWCLKIRWIQVFVGYDVTISITLGGYTDYVLFTYLVDATFVCIIYHEPCYLECIDASLDSIQDMSVGKINRSQIGPIDYALLSILMYYIGSLQPYVYMYIKKISIHIIKMNRNRRTNEKKPSAAIYKGREKTIDCATFPKIARAVYRWSTFEPYQDKSYSLFN